MKCTCNTCGNTCEYSGASGGEVRCLNCQEIISLDVPSPYPVEIEEEVRGYLEKIREATGKLNEGAKQCVLWHLEKEWLGAKGHWAILKLGKNLYSNPASCSVCGNDTTNKGITLHVVSKWRNTANVVNLCEEHCNPNHLLAADIDLHVSNEEVRLHLY